LHHEVKKKILIVDDEMDMRIFLTALFETSGYEAIVTKDGRDGYRIAKEIAPDLIVLDIMMPGEGGVHMYRHLKIDKILKGIPIIMLSAVEEKTFLHYIKMLRIRLNETIPQPDAYVEKPPEPEELLKIAESLL
jgi:DNA-binding response OmpR family regulator